MNHFFNRINIWLLSVYAGHFSVFGTIFGTIFLLAKQQNADFWHFGVGLRF